MSQNKMLKSAGLPDERVQLLDNEGYDVVADLRPPAMPAPDDLIAVADARLGPAVGLRPRHGDWGKVAVPKRHR